jgi:hypothetical protein
VGNASSSITAPCGLTVASATLTTLALPGIGNRAVYSTDAGLLTNSSSDLRLKTNIETIQGGLEIVKNLNPVRFDWRLSASSRDIGFIAQEVSPHVPEIVWTGNDGMYGMEYAKLVAILTSAIKELSAEVDELKNRISAT